MAFHYGSAASQGRPTVADVWVITTFPAPVEMYDGTHAEMIRQAGPSIDGLLVHVGHATTDGFQIVCSPAPRAAGRYAPRQGAELAWITSLAEVWESKGHCDRANTDIVFPLMRELGGDQPLPSMEQATEAFDVHGLVIPSGNILM